MGRVNVIALKTHTDSGYIPGGIRNDDPMVRIEKTSPCIAWESNIQKNRKGIRY